MPRRLLTAKPVTGQERLTCQCNGLQSLFEISGTPEHSDVCVRRFFHSPWVNIPATNQSPRWLCPAQELEYKTPPPHSTPEPSFDHQQKQQATWVILSLLLTHPSIVIFYSSRTVCPSAPHYTPFPVLTYVTWEIGQETLCTKKGHFWRSRRGRKMKWKFEMRTSSDVIP